MVFLREAHVVLLREALDGVWFCLRRWGLGFASARRGSLSMRFGFFVVAMAYAFCLRGAGGLVALAFALASASCYLASCVAPVRGGTYFSLPPQRKVGKRKRLTP
ncbi:hypothetical protein SAMN05192544_11504, partial [Paraburkholderia hospita]|uniref:hypothetical protein n=1 Tax=Paraburkholderia hospita TaxID=169430 RepID=UPI0008A7C089